MPGISSLHTRIGALLFAGVTLFSCRGVTWAEEVSGGKVITVGTIYSQHSIGKEELRYQIHHRDISRGIRVVKRILKEKGYLSNQEKYLFSRLLIEEGNLEEARKFALRISGNDPKGYLRFIALGEVKTAEGLYDEAGGYFISGARAGFDGGYYLAALCEIKMGRQERARELLEKIPHESRYFGRGVEKRAITLMNSGRSEEAIASILEGLSILPDSRRADRVDLFALLGKIYINDERAGESLKIADAIEEEVTKLEGELEKWSKDDSIERFQALLRIIEQYLPRRNFESFRESYGDLEGIYLGWIKTTSLMNLLRSFKRSVRLYKVSLIRAGRLTDQNLETLARTRSEYDVVKRDLFAAKERIIRGIDEYPLGELLRGEKTYLALQNIFSRIEDIEILSAEFQSLAERVKNNPLYEKMDPGKITAQNRAISQFFRIKKDVQQLRVDAGIVQLRLINLLKEPVTEEFMGLMEKAASTLKKHGELLATMGTAEKGLTLEKEEQRRNNEAIDKLSITIEKRIVLGKRIDNTIRENYHEASHRAVMDIRKSLQGKRAFLHYLKGRAHLLYASRGENGYPAKEYLPFEMAYRELKRALDLGIYEEFKPECYYGIAEISMAREEEAYGNQMERLLEGEEKGEEYTEPTPDYGESISYFNRIIEEYPESPYYENSLYSYAYAIHEMGLIDSGIRIYEKLIEKFPRTRYADEINLRIAEYYFTTQDFKKAESHYRKVLGESNRELYVTSKFKLGWALYNQERYEDAVDAFLVPLKLSVEGDSFKFARLIPELVHMIAKCHIEMEAIETLEDSLTKEGLSSFIPASLLEGEKILFESSRYSDVLIIAGIMKDRYPYCLELLQSEVIAARSHVKLLDLEAGHMRYAQTYHLFGPKSKWAIENARKKEWLEKAHASLDKSLRVSAYYYYKLGKEGRETESFDRAIEIFRNYLRISPDSPHATDVRYDMAYSLYKVGSYRSASRIFERVASSTRSQNLHEPSLFMAVQCAKALYVPDNIDTVTEIVRIARRYLEDAPGGERAVDVTLDLVSAYFNGNMFPEAVEVASRLESITQENSMLTSAKEIEGESYFYMGKFRESELAFRDLLRILPRGDEERRISTTKYIGFSIFKHAKYLMEEGRLDEAIREYLRLFDEFPELEFSPLAALEAGKAIKQTGNVNRGKGIFERVANAYPGSPYEREARRQLALMGEERGDYGEAAKHYRLIGEGLEKRAEGAAYLKKAATLFYEMGSLEDAGATFIRLKDNTEVSIRVKIEAAYYAGLSFIHAGEETKGTALLREAVATNDAAPEREKNIYHASMAQLELTMIDFALYRNIKIIEPFEKTFREKKKYLELLIESYLAIAKLGVPETFSASLYQIGESYEEFKNSILDAPIPSGLNDIEQEEYIFLLEEKAVPYEEEASKSHEKNVRKGATTGYTNKWVIQSWDKLKETRRGTFGRKPATPLTLVPLTEPPDLHTLTKRRR